MMTTTKNSKRKNQPNGVDINQFPKLGAAIDETVTLGLLNGGGGRQEPYPYGHAALRGSGPSGRDTGSFGWYSVSCCRRRRPRNRRGCRHAQPRQQAQRCRPQDNQYRRRACRNQLTSRSTGHFLSHSASQLNKKDRTSGGTRRTVPLTPFIGTSLRSFENTVAQDSGKGNLAKGIVIAMDGNNGNVEFRRMFDPRLTEEFQLGGGSVTLRNSRRFGPSRRRRFSFVRE